jgi:hypothetical protein
MNNNLSILILLIQLDALRHDYINSTESPFLWELAQKGIWGVLQPTFGFEPDGAYLAGLYPDECNGGAHFWRNPEGSPFKFTKWLPDFFENLERIPGKIFRKLLTKIIRFNKKWQYEFMPCAPYDVLIEFAPVPKLFPPVTRGNEIKDIFFLCNENNIPWIFHGSPQHRVTVDEGVSRINSLLSPPVGFAFWHICDLDSVGHRFGPESSEVKKVMKKVEEKIAEVGALLKRRFENLNIVIMGDHGMAQVKTHIDIISHLQSCGINGKSAPLYFIDSTMARFWFSEQSQYELVKNALKDLSGGRILAQEDIDHYHLNYKHNRFGELIYLAKPGVLFSPNYFQGRSLVKGMHGYAPECPEQQSAFIIHSPNVTTPRHFEGPVDMRRIFPTMLKLLGIAKPNACKVESII